MKREESFFKWLKRNKELNKDNELVLSKDKSLCFKEIIDLLNELSSILNIDIINNTNYEEAKKYMDLLCDNKKTFNHKKYDLYLEIMNYYLKYILTTYEKKYDIESTINNYNSSFDISDISHYSKVIFEELSKWPYMYIILKDNKIVTRVIKTTTHNVLSIPMYSNKDVISNEYLNNEYKIKKVRFNLFIKELDNEGTEATSIVLNPKFDNHDKVFIEIEDSFWYYFGDLSNYL